MSGYGYWGYMPYCTGTNVTTLHWNQIFIGMCNGLVLTVMSISTDDLVLTRFFLFQFCCSCWSVKCCVMYQTPRCHVLIASPHQHAYSHYTEARFVWSREIKLLELFQQIYSTIDLPEHWWYWTCGLNNTSDMGGTSWVGQWVTHSVTVIFLIKSVLKNCH